jgi:hypothetical protein
MELAVVLDNCITKGMKFPFIAPRAGACCRVSSAGRRVCVVEASPRP